MWVPYLASHMHIPQSVLANDIIVIYNCWYGGPKAEYEYFWVLCRELINKACGFGVQGSY